MSVDCIVADDNPLLDLSQICQQMTLGFIKEQHQI
jgi:hypothetical protein